MVDDHQLRDLFLRNRIVRHGCVLIPGDGIGPEVVGAARRIIDAALEGTGSGLDWVEHDAGTAALEKGHSDLLPDSTVEAIVERGIALKGPCTTPIGGGFSSVNVALRKRLDLYGAVRPVRSLDGVDTRYQNVDLVVVRENTEGLYTGIGGQFKRDTPDEVAIEAEMNTRKGVERIIRAAFEYAVHHGKQKVCMSDKSNAMRHGHDLWQRTFKAVGQEYPSIETSHLYVDVLAMELVRCPEQFQVIVTNNLFGDIITDLGAILQGGIGLAGSGNINPGKVSLFEPVHGSAPTIAGQGIANPLAAILTVAMMLEYLGHAEDAARVDAAVAACLTNDLITPELGGSLSTKEVGDAVLARL